MIVSRTLPFLPPLHTVYPSQKNHSNIRFFLHDVPMLTLSSPDNTVKATDALTHTLLNTSHAAPFTNIDNAQITEFFTLAEIFCAQIAPPTPVVISPNTLIQTASPLQNIQNPVPSTRHPCSHGHLFKRSHPLSKPATKFVFLGIKSKSLI